MKNKISIIFFLLAVSFLLTNCKESEMDNIYPDPSTTSTASVENFFTGVMQSENSYVMPWYWRLFVVEVPQMGHYTQMIGWTNDKSQYIPSNSAIQNRWDTYYNTLTQYRRMQKLNSELSASEQGNKRIFMIAASIFLYDQTSQIVDMFGDIPFSKACLLRDAGGSLSSALAPYDKAEDVYTSILDSLKSMSQELNTMQIPSYYAGLFKAKDYLNNGSVDMWKRYCNSLRLRLLTRVSGVSSFADRAKSEINTILSDPTTYPVVETNDENIEIRPSGPDLLANYDNNIQNAFESWSTSNAAPYAPVKFMKDNSDPRLPVLFSPNVNGEYVGVNPTLDQSTQSNMINNNLIARYDTTTISRNDYVPGIIITASEVSFIKAEAYVKGWVSGNAKSAYETGIRQSIEFYYSINHKSDYNHAVIVSSPAESDIMNYLNSAGVSYDNNSDKMNLIATQKWLHLGVLQLPQTWAEYRRLHLPVLTFMTDNSNVQTLPPVRFTYPDVEKNQNAANYSAVSANDKLTTNIFWDVQ